jgi:hypothetical protein
MFLLFGITPQALALWVGFNPDIHMDIQGVVANDFHVQGSIESGDPCGNWAQPPKLVGHIDGGFPNFVYSITPDKSDPKQQNWFTFSADWSGKDYQFCEVIHLGLFFDVDCHNVAVNLVGWWTKDGQPIPPNIVPPPLNGGAVPLPGFNVQDQPPHQMPQHIRLHNDSDLFDGGGGGGGGIETEMVQLELVSLTREQLNEYLGPNPFEELRLGGRQEYLPWIAVENPRGVISETNPQAFVPDSFFDVFFDISFPIHPVKPIVIPPGGFLIVRERLLYTNNARQPDIRWDWMIHGAHESDLGDAPDSTNSFGMPPPPALMTAYPKGGPMNIQANYPSVYQTGSPPFGPIHWAAPLIAFLGPMVSSEMEADIGPDMDPNNNIIPLQDKPDLDGFDDGVAVPLLLPHCVPTTFNYTVMIRPPMPPPMPQTPPLYVNVWFDWNRDGDWDDTMQCPGTTAPIPAPEWAVQNQVLVGLPVGLNNIITPPFMCWHPAGVDTPPIWMRITLSEQRWNPTSGVLGNGGCGPAQGYLYGETEDYYFVPEVPPPPEMDYGDAPEGSNAIAYPATGVTGAFPTCKTIGPAGWIQHTNFGAWFGPSFDLELDGNAGLCPTGCFPPYDQDECFADGDAGLIVPLPYTIDAALNVVPCPQCSSGTPLGDTCQTALWGTNIDIDVHNHMPSQTIGYVNLLIDWNQDGKWSGSSNCPTAATPEHVLVNFPVPNPYDGPLSGLMPGAGFLIGPNRGYVWARFTITEQPVPVPDWNGEGSFEDGETEDYLLEIGKVYEPKPPVEHLKWSQPPIEWNPRSPTPIYCGWDEPSYSVQLTGAPTVWKIVADDFRCLGTMPVTSIHWWGSYKGWNSPEPAMPSPVAWQIGFWTNAPPPPTGGISQPGELLWLLNVPDSRVKEEWVGMDKFPNDTLPETCFQYYLQLNPQEYFRQERYINSTTPNIYWISITAVYPGLLPPPEFPWGWKTRPAHWMDDAVTFTLQQEELKVGMTIPPTIVRPIEGYICGLVESYDAAFELDTDPNWIKWEQAYTGIRDWPHYEDELSMGTQHTIVEPATKYIQKPDLTETGIDVDATFIQTQWRPQILADDFNCVTTGLITDIHIWGSWYHDYLPGKPDNVQFLLTIYSDDPIGSGGSDPSNKYSKPDQVLWRKMFAPGQFNVSQEASDLKEGYYVPCAPYYEPFGDSVCWKYDFNIDPCEAFPQQGTTARPVTYWLAVQALPIVGPQEARFGWKTSFQHWNDDAVWAAGTELPYTWNELRYPDGHPYAGRSIDLAFAITTKTEREELVIHRQVADDWRCKGKTPVTAIVWWGSYIGYRYEACQCQATTPQPIKPDYFLLQIWTNVSAGADTPYSHPGGKKWEYKAYDYDEVLVGYDKHPEPGESGIGYEPVFRYSVKLPDPNWYRQKEVNEVFWLSVVAVYKDPLPIIYPWGWTNHQCVAWEPKGLNDEVAYWKLNETSGIIASDSSGNGNDGTLVGNATWTAGKICGGALDLDGNGDYVKTANTTTGLNFAPGSFSVSGWIKPRQVTGGYRTILEYDRDGNDKNRFGLWLSSEGKFHFRVGRDTKNSNQILTSNQWYLLTATYDSISKTMSLYIDGQFDSSGTHSNGFTSANVAKLTIGVRGTEDAEYFDGLVDDIRIYKRALSASEVRALADMGKNDDAVAGYVSEAGMWVWEELYDQTGRSEDMSFVLFTDEPGCWLFPQIYTTYADWVTLGKPNCWCGIYGNPQWPYQCDGDADNLIQGLPKYRIYTNDFNILVANWKMLINSPGFDPCADFDHKPQGIPKYRVYTNDFNILVGNWKKTNAQLPGNCVRPE